MNPAAADGPVVGPAGRPAWILRAVMVAVAVTVVVVNLVGRVDWAAVRDALAQLT